MKRRGINRDQGMGSLCNKLEGTKSHGMLRKAHPWHRNSDQQEIEVTYRLRMHSQNRVFCLNKLTCERTSLPKDLMIHADHLHPNLMEAVQVVKAQA